MIARMKKVFVVTRSPGREQLLAALREIGVVHLQPVDPAARAPEKLRAALSRIKLAQRAIATVIPAGERPPLDADFAAREILNCVRRVEESRTRLAAVHREAERIRLWGDLRLEQLKALAEAGVNVSFYSVPAKQIGDVGGDCVAALAELPGKRILVVVAQREGQPAVPQQAQLIEPPYRDRAAILAEAKQLDQALAEDADRLAGLANLADALEAEGGKLSGEVQFAGALAGGMQGEELFAVQGWAPADSAATLAANLAGRQIVAGVTARDPTPDEQPPTLIRYPRWARPIKGLFDILGTSPGYREFDVSGFFMIALPIFAAMIIGDAGYGLLFVLLPLLLYRKAVGAAGTAKIHLVIAFGAATIIWGVVTGTYFGFTPKMMIDAGGLLSYLGQLLAKGQLIRGGVREQMYTITKVGFVFGTVHLTVAQLRQALKWLPKPRFLSHVGWAVLLWGMLGIIWYLFFSSQETPPRPPHPATGWLLIVGGAAAILFAHPSRNPLKMIGFGLASFPLSLVAAFSDTLSYIRLMAVGMASVIIAQTFNGLGAQCASSTKWLWLAGGPIILIGHALNVALCLIAILAHGVRLNMLEFSSNAGIEWAGYDYEPFTAQPAKET